MPQFDITTFTPQLFWLTVTFAALFFAMLRYALPRLTDIMEARQRHIEDDLEKASTIRAEANTVMAEYEQAVADARAQATAVIKQAAEEMSAESAKRQESFGRELAERTAAAEQRIVGAKQEALGQIAQVAGEVANTATVKLIGVEVDPDQVRQAVDDAMRRSG